MLSKKIGLSFSLRQNNEWSHIEKRNHDGVYWIDSELLAGQKGFLLSHKEFLTDDKDFLASRKGLL